MTRRSLGIALVGCLVVLAGCDRLLPFGDPSRDRAPVAPDGPGLDRPQLMELGPDRLRLDRLAERVRGPEAGASCASACPTSCPCCPLSCCPGTAQSMGPGGVALAPAIAPLVDLSKLAAGRLTLRICGLDLSGVSYKGLDCAYPTANGAWAVLGIGPVGNVGTEPAKFQVTGVWLRIFSHLPSSSSYCGAPISNPDLGYRMYHVQVWLNGTESKLGHQYNVEKGELFGAKYDSTEKLDVVLQLTRKSALTFSFEVWVRLHVSGLGIDGCTESFNQAMNTETGIDQWVHVADWKTPPLGSIKVDTISFPGPIVEGRLLLQNGPGTNATPHRIAWDGVRLEAK